MQTEAVALIITAVFGGIASIIYSLKHIRKSECCGSRCIQVQEGDIGVVELGGISPISPVSTSYKSSDV